MKQLLTYLRTNKAVTLTAMWVTFAIALGYMLLCLLVFPSWPFWLCLVPAIPSVLLRFLYADAAKSL